MKKLIMNYTAKICTKGKRILNSISTFINNHSDEILAIIFIAIMAVLGYLHWLFKTIVLSIFWQVLFVVLFAFICFAISSIGWYIFHLQHCQEIINMCNFGLNSKRESEKDKYFNWIKEKYPTEQKHLNKLNL